jgi:hypothetical protein
MPAQGCALATLGTRPPFHNDGILKGLRRRSPMHNLSQLFQSCEESIASAFYPGLLKRNPGLAIANAFSDIHFR